MAAIFERLGFLPIFVYEKLRTEWADNEGHVVVDVTPIGDFAELEGSSEWIDRIAAKLGISSGKLYEGELRPIVSGVEAYDRHPAANMTFAEIGHQEAQSADAIVVYGISSDFSDASRRV